MQNLNRVVLTANLTRDPETRTTSGGVAICNLRVAVNTRVKRNGEWADKPNYFDVVVFGTQAENCQKYLTKGRAIAVDGRLDWREWTTDKGDKRQAVQIMGESIQFLSDGSASESRGSSGGGEQRAAVSPARGADDDIPF
jgi:single-strand DNA-binding protein